MSLRYIHGFLRSTSSYFMETKAVENDSIEQFLSSNSSVTSLTTEKNNKNILSVFELQLFMVCLKFTL